MPLDPNIIAGIKSPQFDLSQFSPMNAMTNVMKLRQLDQEGELNALTLGERKSLSKFLPGKDLSNPDIVHGVVRALQVAPFGLGRVLAGPRGARLDCAGRELDRGSVALRPERVRVDNLHRVCRAAVCVGEAEHVDLRRCRLEQLAHADVSVNAEVGAEEGLRRRFCSGHKRIHMQT